MRDYAVLAQVSPGYPPPKGRLPTCYSPVRHFTHGLLHFLVRLACVKRAANVDSEPGSNSRLNRLSIGQSLHPLTRTKDRLYRLSLELSKLTNCMYNRPTRLSMIYSAYRRSCEDRPTEGLETCLSTKEHTRITASFPSTRECLEKNYLEVSGLPGLLPAGTGSN